MWESLVQGIESVVQTIGDEASTSIQAVNPSRALLSPNLAAIQDQLTIQRQRHRAEANAASRISAFIKGRCTRRFVSKKLRARDRQQPEPAVRTRGLMTLTACSGAA